MEGGIYDFGPEVSLTTELGNVLIDAARSSRIISF